MSDEMNIEARINHGDDPRGFEEYQKKILIEMEKKRLWILKLLLTM